MRRPAATSLLVLESSSTIAFGTTDTSVSPKKPIAAGRIVEIAPSVIDPAASANSLLCNAYALLDRIGAKIFVAGKPIAGTASNDFVPLSCLLGSRENPAPFDIPVDRDTEITAEFKSFDTAGAPPLKARLVFKLAPIGG